MEIYSRYLQTLPSTNQEALIRAEEVGLDTHAIARKAATRSSSSDQSSVSLASTPLQLDLTQDDHQKIQAVNWLSLSPDWRIDLLLQTNLLVRSFMGSIYYICDILSLLKC